MNEIERAILNLTIELQNGTDLYLTSTTAISALEKQIPKKVYHFLDDDTFITTCCDYDVTNEDYDYCPNCGQLLGDVEEVEGVKLKCDKTSEIVREMTDSEKAESIIKLINDYDINSTFLFGWQIEFIEKLCRKQLNNGWIPCSERLPDEKENPITWDYYEYTVTICICGKYDIRHYKFGRGKWWNGGADMSSIVIAWQPLPEKYTEVSE